MPISGPLVTARDLPRRAIRRRNRRRRSAPLDPKAKSCLRRPYTARPGRVIGSAGPTTVADGSVLASADRTRAARDDGKGRRSEAVKASMRARLRLLRRRRRAALLAGTVTSAEVIAYPDLGAEAVFLLEVVGLPSRRRQRPPRRRRIHGWTRPVETALHRPQ